MRINNYSTHLTNTLIIELAVIKLPFVNKGNILYFANLNKI